MVPRTEFRFQVIMLAALLLPVVSAMAQNDQQRDLDAQRRYLDGLRQEVRNLERDVKQIEKDIADRKKQLADAPKTIGPAEKALAEWEKKQEKAKAAMPDVKKRLDDSEGKSAAVLKSLKSQYGGAAEFDAAEAKLAEARTQLEAARVIGVDKLKTNADYKAAKNRVEISQTRVSVLNDKRESGEGSPSEIAEANSLLLRYQLELDQLEAKVLSSDERYRKAKAEVDELEKTLSYLRSQMVEKVKTHPDYAAAEKELGETREVFAAAIRELAEASKSRAEASGTLNKLKAQVKEFERDTERLKSRQTALETQLRAKQRRADDYERSMRR